MNICEDGLIRLVNAVMIQAITDAKRGSKEALDWLKTDAALWLEAIGIEYSPENINRIIHGRDTARLIKSYHSQNIKRSEHE